jgi:hypothetical protein
LVVDDECSVAQYAEYDVQRRIAADSEVNNGGIDDRPRPSALCVRK